MIQLFKAKNFLSIREEQTLDFTASSDKTYEEYTVTTINNVRISKIGIVYGSNASGKSNILKALSWLFDFMTSDEQRKPSQGTGLTPFLLDEKSRNEKSSFDLVFYANDIKFEYHLVLDSDRIYEEALYSYPNGRKAKFFERTRDEEKGNSKITFGDLLRLNPTQKLYIKIKCIDNIPVMTAYQTSNVEKSGILDSLIKYIGAVVPPALTIDVDLSLFANRSIKNDDECKKFIAQMLVKADFNISNFYVKEEKVDFSDDEIEKLKQFAKLMQRDMPQLDDFTKEELFFTHRTPSYTGDFSYNVESRGTQRMYGLLSILYFLIKNNIILISDEFENSLHYDLFTYFIKTFLANSPSGQMIFSTHNLLLLDEDYIRRDMIFFASKNEYGATQIYRAKDFGLHKDVSILNAYRNGKLGAIPQLGSIFVDE
jgi:hypothetical protein